MGPYVVLILGIRMNLELMPKQDMPQTPQHKDRASPSGAASCDSLLTAYLGSRTI